MKIDLLSFTLGLRACRLKNILHDEQTMTPKYEYNAGLSQIRQFVGIRFCFIGRRLSINSN